MIRSTTILCVRKDGRVAMAGDGQVSMNNTDVKHHARKVRKVYRDQILAGFAGAAADAFPQPVPSRKTMFSPALTRMRTRAM